LPGAIEFSALPPYNGSSKRRAPRRKEMFFAMPMIDMPLAELKQYKGINPRPADFDAYWEKALAEMHALDANVELVPAEFQVPGAECFHLYFTGVGGSRIHAKYLRPAGVCEPHPAVCMFHGYTGDSGDWCSKLGYVKLGYSVAALDCRGQAGLSEDTVPVKGNTHNGQIIRGLEDGDEALYFRRVFLDTAQLAGIVMDMPEVDENRVGALGGSQGGGLTLACAALEPRIKRIAPQFPFLCDYRRVWEMDLDIQAYAELRTFFRQKDPTHEKEEMYFTRLGYIDNRFLAPRIKAKTLWACGLMDNVCPPSTQFAAYNRITAEKEVILFPDYGHDIMPGSLDNIYQFYCLFSFLNMPAYR